MKSLYESILRSTNSGKDVFKPKYITGLAGFEFWKVNSDMKKWFEKCDKNYFFAICEDCFDMLKNSNKKYVLKGQTIIEFNDGNFVICMSISPKSRNIEFNFYFSDTVSYNVVEIQKLINKQYSEIVKMTNADELNWIPKELYSIPDAGMIRILKYIQNNINAIIKQ